MAIDEDTINNILNNYNSFTKEELEAINTYEMKNLAKYNVNKYKILANTEPRYFQSNVIISKFGDLAMRHKELILNTTLEHIQVHKEILLQLLSILQSLVNNPNVLDQLISFLNSNWYGQQDFKQFISSLIDEEMRKLDNLYSQQLILTTQPIVCYLPELYNSQNPSIDTQTLFDYYNTLEQKYILEP